MFTVINQSSRVYIPAIARQVGRLHTSAGNHSRISKWSELNGKYNLTDKFWSVYGGGIGLGAGLGGFFGSFYGMTYNSDSKLKLLSGLTYGCAGVVAGGFLAAAFPVTGVLYVAAKQAEEMKKDQTI